jgi:hypothetical protein
MNTIDFNKHDVDIFINGTWQKYFYHHVGFKKGREAGLTLEGEEVAL